MTEQPLTMLVGRNHNQTHSFDYCTFADLLERVKAPAQLSGEDIKEVKASAPICAPYNAPVKTKDEVLAHNKFTMLWADLDSGNQGLAALQAQLAGLGIESYAIYSTANSAPDNKRWRVLVETQESMPFDRWHALQSYLSHSLGDADDVALRPQQILYLPFECEHTQHYESAIGDGDALDTLMSGFKSKADAYQLDQETKAAQEAALAPAKPKARVSLAQGQQSPIELFNAAYDMASLLDSFGYKRVGKKYIHPNSSSGAAGVTLLDDGRSYYSHHSSDPLADSHTHDAFDLFVHWEHGDDFNAAVKAAANDLDQQGQKDRQREHAKAKEAAHFDAVPSTASEPSEAIVLPNSWDLAADAKPARYLVDGILEEDAHGILGGASMTYKSFLVKRLAYSLCSGAPFAGREVYKAGAVVYVCGEGQGAINRRLKALLIKLGKPKHPIHVITSGVSLTCPDSMGRLLERIKPLKPVLVIFDTFASLSGGIEENSNSEVGEALNRVRDTCRVAGASSLIVHHFGKNAEQGFRGASAFTNNVDYALLAHRRGAEDSRESGLTCHKMKDGEHFKEIFFKADIVQLGIYDQKGKESTSLILEHDVNGVSNKPLTQDEIMLRELKHLQSKAPITSTTDDPTWISWKDWRAAAQEYDIRNIPQVKKKLLDAGRVFERNNTFRAA